MPEPPAAPPHGTVGQSASPRLVLGFDFGTRRIGVAIGDTLTGTARPLTTLPRSSGHVFGAISDLLARYAPQEIVVGLPYNMDGTETTLTQAVRSFARELEQQFGRPVALVDERLSSREAEAALRTARRSGLRRRRVAREDIDREAARVIVERWLADEAMRSRADTRGVP